MEKYPKPTPRQEGEFLRALQEAEENIVKGKVDLTPTEITKKANDE